MARYDAGRTSNQSGRSTRIYKDLDLDFQQNTATKDIQKMLDVESVKRSVKNLINLKTCLKTFLHSSMKSYDTVEIEKIGANGYFNSHLGFSKLLLGASAGPRGPPRRGKTLCLRSFPRRSTHGAGSVGFCQGL